MASYRRKTYWSVADLSDDFSIHKEGRLRPSWHGVSSEAEIKRLAVNGWASEAAETLEIADSAIQTIAREHDVPVFESFYDTAGMTVDVGRYLEGEPECMMDFSLTPVPSSGLVITLCASICYSASVTPTGITKRGRGVAALAFTLNNLGFQTELWADISIGNGNGGNRTRILIKGANDELDPARVMFGYAHPGMYRGLGFGCPNFQHGMPIDPERDLPDGTIYLPAIATDDGVPEPYQQVVTVLRQLGIVED